MRLSLILTTCLLALAAVLFVSTPSEASCKDCYECSYDSSNDASCCRGIGCSFMEVDSQCDHKGKKSDCYVDNLTDPENPKCRGAISCSGGGSGGPGGGGSGGPFNDGCTYGPTSFCPMSCSSCNWDPFF
ncbi:MAG: hypothetical protein AAGD06_33055 [Acidobacteriota bacterium]